jgi:Ca2+-binding EF-hand superfamily protein
VTQEEIDKLFTLFRTADTEDRGHLTLGQFYRFFDLDPTPFAKRVFAIMGAPQPLRLVLLIEPAQMTMAAARWISGRCVSRRPGAANHRDVAPSPPQFVVAVWNYASFDSITLPTFAFNLFDTDGSGWLEVVSGGPRVVAAAAANHLQSEIRDMVASVYGQSFDDNARVQKVLQRLDANGDGTVCAHVKGHAMRC